MSAYHWQEDVSSAISDCDAGSGSGIVGELDDSGKDSGRIVPAQVTKPIQLLAAWLVGLIAIDGTFLTAARLISSPPWAAGLLVIAAVLSVPVFLGCLFLLQTRFRPEMQEDMFYSKHLERKFSQQSQKMTTIEATNHDFVGNFISSSSRPKVRQNAMSSSYVSVNDLLPNFRDVIRELNSISIKPAQTFGSTSTILKPPKRFVISVGINTPYDLAQKIIRKLRDLSLDGVGIGWDEADTDMIYIGAYSYDVGHNFVPVSSPDFERLIDENISSKQFFSILDRFEHREDN